MWGGTRREALTSAAKRRIVRSPLESALREVQLAGYRRKGRREPELARLHAEHAAIRDAFRLAVVPTSHCIDVGAHIGSMLSQLCRLAPGGRHLAVEADPDKAGWLGRRFPEVSVVNAAVADSPGEVWFGRDVRRSGYSRVVDAAEVESVRSEGLDVLRVRSVRLDDVVGERPVDLVKIDVEGHELECLRGAPRLLAEQRPRLVVEAGWVDGDPSGSTMPHLYRLLEAAGYRLWTVLGFVEARPALDLDRFVDTHRWPFEAWNFVALPDGDPLAARVRA